ncbi:hypothetical protein D3C86_1678470 [compost metagenome]
MTSQPGKVLASYEVDDGVKDTNSKLKNFLDIAQNEECHRAAQSEHLPDVRTKYIQHTDPPQA